MFIFLVPLLMSADEVVDGWCDAERGHWLKTFFLSALPQSVLSGVGRV